MGSVRFGAGRGENFAPRTAPHPGPGHEISGPRNGDLAGGEAKTGHGNRENGARGGVKKKDPPPRPAVRCGAGIIHGAPEQTLLMGIYPGLSTKFVIRP